MMYKTRATLESTCYGGLCTLDVEDMWELFDSLASYQWQYESSSESFVGPSQPPYRFHAQSPWAGQLSDLCHCDSSYPLVLCSYCQAIKHDVTFYPYYDIYHELYVRLNDMIKTT